MNTRQAQRLLYLGSRDLGDYNAARRGPRPLARRLARRQVQRSIVGPAMNALFRGLFR
jgi:hypothetical protein